MDLNKLVLTTIEGLLYQLKDSDLSLDRLVFNTNLSNIRLTNADFLYLTDEIGRFYANYLPSFYFVGNEDSHVSWLRIELRGFTARLIK